MDVGVVHATPADVSGIRRVRRGVRSRLLDRVEAEVARRGGDRIRLAVVAENDRAIGFSEAAGYDSAEAFHEDRIGARTYRDGKALCEGRRPPRSAGGQPPPTTADR
jgi:hypothetical protein